MQVLLSSAAALFEPLKGKCSSCLSSILKSFQISKHANTHKGRVQFEEHVVHRYDRLQVIRRLKEHRVCWEGEMELSGTVCGNVHM